MTINLGFVLNIIDDLQSHLTSQDYITCMNTLRDANAIVKKHEEKICALWRVYYELRDENELTIVSNEIGKSKPSTLFFLSKFGCQFEKVKFYSEITKKQMWDEIDVLLTSNPNLLLEYPSDKIVIKYETEYNLDVNSEHTINKIKELDDKLQKLELC